MNDEMALFIAGLEEQIEQAFDKCVDYERRGFDNAAARAAERLTALREVRQRLAEEVGV